LPRAGVVHGFATAEPFLTFESKNRFAIQQISGYACYKNQSEVTLIHNDAFVSSTTFAIFNVTYNYLVIVAQHEALEHFRFATINGEQIDVFDMSTKLGCTGYSTATIFLNDHNIFQDGFINFVSSFKFAPYLYSSNERLTTCFPMDNVIPSCSPICEGGVLTGTAVPVDSGFFVFGANTNTIMASPGGAL